MPFISNHAFSFAVIAALAGCAGLLGLEPLTESGTVILPGCGNGQPDDGEQCDDGDGNDFNDCNNRCLSKLTIGCDDGNRDGFASHIAYPRIAACAGSWGRPGIRNDQRAANCLGGGDDNATYDTSQCNAANLCAIGWHVCKGAAEVATVLGALPCTPADTNGFFATAQPASNNDGVCLAETAPNGDDLFGCANGSADAMDVTCTPLNRRITNCMTTGTAQLTNDWKCDTSQNTVSERLSVTKTGTLGGVLCCKD